MKRIWGTIWVTFMLLAMSGCVHQELLLPGTGNSSYSAPAEQNATVDVSDLNVNVQEEQVVTRLPFPVSEYSRLPRSGNATVKGSIYVIGPSGEKVYGKQTRLYLNPVTSYSRQWYQESYLGGKKMAKADPRLFNYLRFTTSDASGHFAFYGVPAGHYYLIGVVRCAQQCGYDTPQTIRVAKEIDVPKNRTVNVDLSKDLDQ